MIWISVLPTERLTLVLEGGSWAERPVDSRGDCGRFLQLRRGEALGKSVRTFGDQQALLGSFQDCFCYGWLAPRHDRAGHPSRGDQVGTGYQGVSGL